MVSWTILAGLRGLLDGEVPPKTAAYRDKDTLHLVLHRGVTLSALEDAVKSGASLWLPSLGLVRLATFVAVFGVGLAALGALTVLGLFQDVASALLLSGDTLAQHWMIGAATLFVSAILLGFLPQALSGPEDSPLQRFVRLWVDDNRHRQRRLAQRLKWARRFGRITNVVVWNAGVPMNGGKLPLLKALNDCKVPVTFRVHTDELAEFQARVTDTIGRSLTIDPAQLDRACENLRGDLDPVDLLEWLLGPQFAEATAYMACASTLRAASIWTPHLPAAHGGAHRGAELLTRHAWEMTRRPSLGEEGEPVIDIDLFMARLELDYGIIRIDHLQNGYDLCADIDWDACATKQAVRFQTILARMPVAPLSERVGDDDPIALFMLMIGLERDEWPKPLFSDLLGQYFESCDRRGDFPGLKAIAAILRQDADTPDEDFGSPLRVTPLLAGVTTENLAAAGRAFEAIGAYDVSLELAQRTAAFEGPSNQVRVARLLEREGRAADGIATLEPVVDLAHRIATRLEKAQRDDQIAPPPPGEVRFALDYFQQRAWIIMSGSLDLAGASASDVRGLLQEADKMLRGRPDFAPTSMDVWRQGNYWATLFEHEGRYETSVERHLQTANIPGTPMRWRYASLINAGFVTRHAAATSWLSDTAEPANLDAIRDHLAIAVRYLREGYEGKVAVGDNDEAPLGAHNAALAELYLVQLEERRGNVERARAHLLSAADLVHAALTLLQETNSSRKRAIIREEYKLITAWAERRRLKLPDPSVTVLKLLNLAPDPISDGDLALLDTMAALERGEIGGASQLNT